MNATISKLYSKLRLFTLLFTNDFSAAVHSSNFLTNNNCQNRNCYPSNLLVTPNKLFWSKNSFGLPELGSALPQLVHFFPASLRSWRFFWCPYWHMFFFHMSYSHVSKYVINVINDKYDIGKKNICQYGYQKKHLDLSNAGKRWKGLLKNYFRIKSGYNCI